MAEQPEQSVLSLEEQIALLKDEVAYLTRRYESLDTQVDATEQSLAALAASQKNKRRIQDLDRRLEIVIRWFQGLACAAAGALLMSYSNPMLNDANPVNDKVAGWIFLSGAGCIGYGLLVLTSNDARVLGWLETINPWRR